MARNIFPKKTWRYTKEFKIKAVKMSLLQDIQVKQVAESLGIHPMMLSRWRKEYREGKIHGDNKGRAWVAQKKGLRSPKEMTENQRLRAEVSRLKKENELLKKWQRYLAEEHQNSLDSLKNVERN